MNIYLQYYVTPFHNYILIFVINVLLLVFTIFYQTQSHHPIILDSDLMKNFQGLTLALNDIVHLCSTH